MIVFPRSIEMRSEVTRVLLGYYDFDRFSVLIGAHTDPDLVPITLLHEALHQRLTQHSTFGAMLTSVAEKVRKEPDKSKSNPLELTLEQLVSHCNVVHEMLATYNSLRNTHREDLVSVLPPEYQTCYQMMDSTVRLVPSTTLWRTDASWHLARIAMLSKPYADLTQLNSVDADSVLARLRAADMLSPNYRMGLLHDAMQRFDIDNFEPRLREWGASNQWIDAFAQVEAPEEIVRRLGMRIEDWPKVYDDWNFFLMHAFLDMFEELLPGLEDARGDASLLSMARDMSGPHLLNKSPTAPGMDALKLRTCLIEYCNQNVAFYPPSAFVADLQPSEGVVLTFAQLTTFRSIGTACLLYLVQPDESRSRLQTEVHVTDYRRKGAVSHFVIAGKNAVDLFVLAKPIVSIVEVSDVDGMWHREFLEVLAGMALEGVPFLYCQANPILMVEELLYSGCAVDLGVSQIGYKEGPLKPDSGLHVCIYWTDVLPFPIFHLSNVLMTRAILEFAEALHPGNDHLRVLDAKKVGERISPVDWSRFLDHPVFQYYLCGKTGTNAVAEARGLPSQQD